MNFKWPDTDLFLTQLKINFLLSHLRKEMFLLMIRSESFIRPFFASNFFCVSSLLSRRAKCEHKPVTWLHLHPLTCAVATAVAVVADVTDVVVVVVVVVVVAVSIGRKNGSRQSEHCFFPRTDPALFVKWTGKMCEKRRRTFPD